MGCTSYAHFQLKTNFSFFQDALLQRSYRWLFGFTLVGEKEKQNTGKDTLVSIGSAGNSGQTRQPESTLAAAQLYRCIIRTFPCGRRSPPKSALEVVSSALPPVEETTRSRVLKDFIFESRSTEMGISTAIQLIMKTGSWNRPFKKIKELLDQDEAPEPSNLGASSMSHDAYRIRRGVSNELASGHVPANLSETSQKGKSDSSSEDYRLLCSKHEEEASKKFFAIVDNICLGNVNDTTSWYRAAQCVSLKAELIADRLGLLKGYSRSNNFSVPSIRRRQKRLPLEDLEAEQMREDSRIFQNWVPSIGQDLSVYVRHSWSSYSSLTACSEDIKKILKDQESLDKSRSPIELNTLKELENMHKDGKFLEWQEAWGGIFVHSLKKLTLRLLCTALFLVESKQQLERDDKILYSEICEAIGVALYSGVIASQGYGYPMHVLSAKRKRKIATAAKVAFEGAAATLEEDGGDDNSEIRETWDLFFMIGKVSELDSSLLGSLAIC